MQPRIGYLICAIALPTLIALKNPAFALMCGATLTLILNQKLVSHGNTYSKYLLQAAIVLLGLNLQVQSLWQTSSDYSGLIVSYVFLALAAGLLVARLFAVDDVSGKLIASATAICGGTAMASLAPILKARSEQLGIAMAIIFILNGVALFSFPAIGHYFQLTQEQFGVWAALAIHDTSSVVATATLYGERAGEIATIVKMGRTLWLIPLVVIFAALAEQDQAKVRIPGFILLFVTASVLGSNLNLPQPASQIIAFSSKALLVSALFFVGTEITRGMLRQLRGKVVRQAIVTWAMVIPATLLAVITWV